jgi:hypothetical protein
MAGNTTTKKEYGGVAGRVVGKVNGQRTASSPNMPGKKVSQLANDERETFAEPMNDGVNAKIKGFGQTYDDIGEKSGFIVDGYLDKQGTPYGESAKFNMMPPGMDIDNQLYAEINEMPLRKVTQESYPGDGWMPAPRDIPE